MNARHAGFEAALANLSEGARQAEARAEERLHTTSQQIMGELHAQQTRLRSESAKALQAQREQMERALDAERAERMSQYADLDGRVGRLQDDHVRAAELVKAHLSDAAVLRTEVLKFPHERYCPGRLAVLDSETATFQAELRAGAPAAFYLDSARRASREMSSLRTQLVALDAQWRACRYVAERGLVQLQQVIGANKSIDVGESFGAVAPGEAPDVDFWSAGALAQLSAEVDALLVRVRDSDDPLGTDELELIVSQKIPELDGQLDDTVARAVSALRGSQLRANLASLISQALEDQFQYQVIDDSSVGYVAGDQRGTFMAKTVNGVGSSEIVIEIAPGPLPDSAPTVELHTFDGDLAVEEHRARIELINSSVNDMTGIDMHSETIAAEPNSGRRDVAELVKRQRRAEAGPA
ncbi:hypothetical protein [Nocardia sp. NPDC058705]|uniref:hypothetical protein n=1 Tax=Nocardia sp. NPDC058705 TaxID=3346609 RepID=UPI003696F14A